MKSLLSLGKLEIYNDSPKPCRENKRPQWPKLIMEYREGTCLLVDVGQDNTETKANTETHVLYVCVTCVYIPEAPSRHCCWYWLWWLCSVYVVVENLMAGVSQSVSKCWCTSGRWSLHDNKCNSRGTICLPDLLSFSCLPAFLHVCLTCIFHFSLSCAIYIICLCLPLPASL